MTVPEAAVLAAQANDTTKPRPRNWTAVPGDQVLRLIEGAAPVLYSDTAGRLREIGDMIRAGKGDPLGLLDDLAADLEHGCTTR